jgi:RHS repeat-associated protein
VLKVHRNGQTAYVNGENKGRSGNMGNFTVYVNPYLVLKSGGYTKHYYIEGQRIVSKLGGGFDNNGKGPLKAGEGKVDYNGKQQKLRDGIVKNLKFLGLDGAILTAGKSGKTPPGQLNTKTQGGGKNDTESFQYFYHPDHLGSTSYITDASGEVYQHLEYFAFGETFVEEHSNTERTPYLYNGKELDEETGLYYYGARYYDPKMSLWASVDKLAEHPSQIDKSPYAYAWNNPIKLNDPDGNCPDCPEDNDKTQQLANVVSATVSDAISGLYNLSIGRLNNTVADNSGDGITIKIVERKDPETIVEAITRPVSDALNASSLISGGSSPGLLLSKASAGVKQAASKAVNKIGNLIDDFGSVTIRNRDLAGKVHPKTGVPFDDLGFPDFSKNLFKGGKNDVIIKPTGDRAADFLAANKAAGYSSTPKGYTWHHHQSTGRMQLVETSVHARTGHTGGFPLW